MKRWTRKLFWTAGLLLVVYAAIGADVVWRARSAYREAERAPTAQLAYAWYETAATLFTPPESRWSRMAREKMPSAKERWRAELRSRKVPFEESMLD